MKITMRLILAINTTAIFIPTVAFSHPGHGVDITTNFMHQIMHYANNHYILLFLLAVIIFGLSARAFINK